MLIVLP